MSDVASTAAFQPQKLHRLITYQGLSLALVCGLITWMLLQAKVLTQGEIQARLEEDRLELLAQVLPPQYYDNQPLKESIVVDDKAFSATPVEIFLAKKSAALSALVFEVHTSGYGGDITLLIALDTQGEILGLRVLSHKETPGLADRIELEKSKWILDFNGHSLANTREKQWAVKKDGGEFDQFTGATITPRAVVNGVHAALTFYARQSAALLRQAQPGEASALHTANSDAGEKHAQ